MQGEPLPHLSDAVMPPLVCGTAALTHAAFAGADFAALTAMIAAADADDDARAYDGAIAAQLAFRRADGLALQDEALSRSPLYRVRGNHGPGDPLRLLALMAPGDMMVNTPLDFITRSLNVRLDLLHLLEDRELPLAIPDHDVAFVACSEADPATLRRLKYLYAVWPRPILNDPSLLPRLARDTLATGLQGIASIDSPASTAIERARLDEIMQSFGRIDDFDYPVLIRPQGSHAGAGLKKLNNPFELGQYLLFSIAKSYFVTKFVNYRGEDGLFRKYRVAFIDRAPFLCHMAVSEDWMIHYLNAGMTESAVKREDEARAMATFDAGFAARHAEAFAALHEVLPFDFYSIDCAETPDGRLLVFEADTAAIIHMMDPPDLFPYKLPQMHRVFDAFGAMLEHRANAQGGTRRGELCPRKSRYFTVTHFASN